MTPGVPALPPPAHSLRSLLVLLVLAALASLIAAVGAGAPVIAAVSLVLGGASLARLASPPPPATGVRVLAAAAGAAVNLVLLAGTLVGSVAAAEFATRWLYRDVTTTADFRGYFTTWWMRS